MLTIEQAKAKASEQGIIAKLSASRNALVLYTGIPDDAGTWLELGKVAIVNGHVAAGSLYMMIGIKR